MLSGEMGGKSVVALILACAVGLLVACGGGGGGGGVDSQQNANQLPDTEQPSSPNTNQLPPMDQPSSPNTNQLPPMDQPSSPNTNQPPPTDQPSSPNTNQPPPTDQPSSTNTNQPPPTDQPPNTGQPPSTEQPPKPDPPSPPSPSFTSYLSDAAVEGVEYSGSAGNGVTGEGGVFTVGVGAIRFFIGGTTLGSVQINENWDNAHLTPADFMGVDMAGVISITRILQGLDEDGNPQNGISISQTARSGAQNLFDNLTESGAIAVINSKTYNIPSADEAMRHFVATRRCIFSGVYVGGYKATVGSDIRDERPGYFIFEPFANRARGEFSAGNDFELMSVAITVGETRSVVTLSAGNELDFVTPRLVTGIWSSGTVSGTNRFTLLAGDPTATLRIVGIEIDEGRTVSGLYALDYFDFDDSFRGQYYDVETDKISALSYDLQGGAWPAAMMTANLTLRGNDVITLEFVRKDDNYGEFEGIGDYDGLSGTWCDFGGSGKPIAPIAPVTPITPIAATQSDSAISITWSAVADATHYKLYRSETSEGSFAQIGGDITGTDYVDVGDLAANTTYYYQLAACNDNGCSDRSREVSATTAPATPLEPTAAAQSDDAVSITWSAVADATHYKLYRATVSGGLLTPIGGEIATTEYVDRGLDANTSYYYRLESCNDNGCSGRSPEVSATTYPAAPDMPEIPTADTQSDSEIEIRWSEVARAMRYKLYRSTVSGGSYSQIGGDIAAISYRDSALSVKTAYYYQLEACNSGGCSGRSPEVAASTYGSLGAARDEITAGLTDPRAIAFSGGRAYVVDSEIDKIISYPVEEDGSLGARRDEITTGLFVPRAIAFSGGRAYVADFIKNKIISYAVEEGGNLGAGRDEITSGLSFPSAIAFSGERVYVAAGSFPGEIISYAVEEGGSLGAGRDEITTDLPLPSAIAFSGGRAYVVDANLDKIISYPEGVNGSLGAGRDEITTGLSFPSAIAFSGERVYVADIDLAKIISYAVDVNGSLGAGRDEITTGLDQPFAVAFSGDRVYVADIDLAKIISYPLFSPVSFAVAPDAPRVVAQSDSEIEIAWNAVLGATHYKLYRSATSGGLFAPIGGDISVTRYRDDDFPGDAFYYYQLEACSGGECSGRSPAVGAVPAMPSTPMAAAQSDSAISIRWSEAAGTTHYKLYRSETSGGSFNQIGGDIAATDYVDDSGLTANTPYYYQLEACNDNGCSSRSPEVSATTAPATPSAPAMPTAATQSDSAISITWSAVAGATHYKLYRSETSGGSFDQIGGDIAATDYVDASDLAANTSYYYQLESCNDNGCSSRSSVVSATTAPGRPSALTVAAQSEGAVSISWSAVAGATHYKLYRSETSEGSFAQIGGDIAATDYLDDSGFVANTSYDYQLESCNGNGCSSRSSAVSATTAPERPEMATAATQSEGAVSISWSAVAGATHYKLYRSATSGGSFDQIGGDIAATDYVDDSGLAANTSYYYQLESCNGNGCSSRSSAVSATTTPERPSALTVAAQSEGAVSISWSAVAGATHYKLYRSETSEGSFAQIGGDIAATDYVDDNDLAANTSYYYQLAACSGNGCSSRSSAVSATTAPETPEMPTAATQSESAISISWSAVAGATHYKLYRSAISGGSFTQIGGDITATDYVDASDLAANTSYYYQLEACNDNGCSGRSLEVSAATYGSLGEPRDEVIGGLSEPFLIVFSSKRAYVVDNRFNLNSIFSYPVEADGILGAARDEMKTGFLRALAFSGGRLYLGEPGFRKVISYAVEADGELGAARDEITTGLTSPWALAFSGERAYVVDDQRHKIISYPVGADGVLGAARDEITTGLSFPDALVFSGGRAYVVSDNPNKIISYPVEANGILGAARDEMATGLSDQLALAFSGGRVYMTDLSGKKIISYAVEEDGSFGESRDEITIGLNSPNALAFSGRRVYVVSFTGKVISYPLLSPVPFAVAPDAPRVFAQSESEIEIAWNAVLGATHYKLYRSETSGGLFAPVGGEISVTRYRDSGPANTFYYYQLEACSGNECSGRSPAVGTAPAMPSPMAATQSDSAISITWSAVAGATHYKLYRATVSGGSLTPIGGKITATEYIDGNLDANTSYYYRLESCNDNGCSGRSLEVSETTAPETPEMPGTPETPTAVAQSESAISISWSAVAGATHYKLYRSATSGGSFTQIGGDIAATDYVDDNDLAANTSYDYQLESCNDNGCSSRSPKVSATTAPAIPSAPAAMQSDGAISITWSAVAGATHYKLYRSETSEEQFDRVGDNIAATEYVDGNLDANTSYYYRLESCNDNGCSGRSPVGSAITAPAMPAVPTAAAQRDSMIVITWSAVAGATHYKLYRATVSGGAYTQIGEEIAATGYLDSNLSETTAYYYRLEACNSGGCSERSPEILVETYGSLGAGRDEITTGLFDPVAIAFSGGRAYVVANYLDKIISYPVRAGGILGAGRDEITGGLNHPIAIAFSGGRAYVVDRSPNKIISYPVEAGGELGAGRDEITTGLEFPTEIAFSGGRAYVVDGDLDKIVSYAVGAGGELGAGRDEIMTSMSNPRALAFSGGRAYVVDRSPNKIISYPVEAGGELGAGRDEITIGLDFPLALAFSGGRVYVADIALDKIISYPVGAVGKLGAGRDEITTGLSYPFALAFSGGRAYVVDARLRKIISYPLFSSVPFAVVPDAPRVFAQSESEIEIAWNAVLGATHYKLYRSETSGGLFAPVGGDISVTRYRDSGPANIFYYYQLEACSGDECSVRSPAVGTAPAMPSPMAAAQSDVAIAITWSAVVGATHYKLYRATVSGGSLTPIGGEIAATEYVDGNLDANIFYYYQLEACNDNGCSGRSLETSAATAPPTAPPAAPTAPDATPQNAGEIEIRWSEVARATHYKLYRSETSGGSFDQIGGDITGVRYADSDLFADTAYYYELEACNSGGCSGRSSEVSATTYPAAPDAPEIPTADTQSDSEIEIRWSEVARAMHYKLYRSTVSGGSYSQIGGDIAAISYRDSALSVKTAYYYQLEACNSGGCSGRSPEVAASTYGSLGAARDEITSLFSPRAIAFSGGRAYVADENRDKIISYPVGANGKLGESRDEITIGLISPTALAFSGGRAYVADRDFSRDSDKIISYAVRANGKLGESRNEITTGLRLPSAIAFSGGRAYVADRDLRRDNDKIISYAVEANGKLGEFRDEITTGLSSPEGIAIAGGRVYVADANLDKIISYAVGTDGSLGESRDEITTDLRLPSAIAFSGGRAYVADAILDKIISYAVGTDGSLGDSRDEITTDLLDPRAIAFSDRRVYVADRDLNKIISYPLIRISPPAAPDAPRIVAHSGSEVEIAWNAVSGATHYKLYRSETSGGLFESIGGDISVTRYRDSGLYYYQLEACNSGGCSGRSFEVACDGALGESRDETGGLGRPYGIAISDGRAYVADRDLGKIISYPVGEDGSLGVARDEITTGLMRPAGIAITGGRVYVVDIGLDKIISYPVEEDGGLGAGRDEITTGLSSPFGIAIAGGRVYVANQGFSNIISYPVGEDGGLGAARNEVMTRSSVPVVIAIAGGRAYVADFHLDKITSYPVETDGELGAGRDEITTGLQEPVGIAIAGNRVYVTGGGLTNGRRNNSKIISYPVEADGSLGAARDEIIVDLNFPVGIAIAGGRVYVADADITGGEDRIVSYPVGEDGELGAARDETTIVDFLRGGIAIAGGRTYLTDGGQDKIISYPVEADGRLGAARDEITTALSSPEGIAIAGGRAYVADSNLNKIISYPVREDGSLGAARDEITTGLSQPRAVAIAGGRAYVTDEFRSKIFSYPVGEDGELGAVREEAKAGFISRLRSIVFSGGRAYVADPGPDRIVSYPVNADGSLGAPRDEITTGLNFPSGIAIASGRAYVTEYETDLRSREVRGKIISYPVEAGGELGAARDETTIGLSSPVDIAIAGGRVYVKDSSLRKIISYPFCSI